MYWNISKFKTRYVTLYINVHDITIIFSVQIYKGTNLSVHCAESREFYRLIHVKANDYSRGIHNRCKRIKWMGDFLWQYFTTWKGKSKLLKEMIEIWDLEYLVTSYNQEISGKKCCLCYSIDEPCEAVISLGWQW